MHPNFLCQFRMQVTTASTWLYFLGGIQMNLNSFFDFFVGGFQRTPKMGGHYFFKKMGYCAHKTNVFPHFWDILAGIDIFAQEWEGGVNL